MQKQVHLIKRFSTAEPFHGLNLHGLDLCNETQDYCGHQHTSKSEGAVNKCHENKRDLSLPVEVQTAEFHLQL